MIYKLYIYIYIYIICVCHSNTTFQFTAYSNGIYNAYDILTMAGQIVSIIKSLMTYMYDIYVCMFPCDETDHATLYTKWCG